MDEINSMPLVLQAKLLRVLEEQKIRRIGGTFEKEVNCRVIAAMNIEPQIAVQQNILRKDLYFRLSVVNIHIPPLRQRKGDILRLANHFIEKYNEKLGTKVKGLTEEAINTFISYSWPGNVRELSNSIEGILNFKSHGYIDVTDLPGSIQNQVETDKKDTDLRKSIWEYERKIIEKTFIKCGFNVSKTAKRLNIPRQTLQYKLKQHKLQT